MILLIVYDGKLPIETVFSLELISINFLSYTLIQQLKYNFLILCLTKI